MTSLRGQIAVFVGRRRRTHRGTGGLDASWAVLARERMTTRQPVRW